VTLRYCAETVRLVVKILSLPHYSTFPVQLNKIQTEFIITNGLNTGAI